MLAEKPDSARRIAHALGTSIQKQFKGVNFFEIPSAFDGKHYAVCSAAGHLYGLGDPAQQRSVYPIFDCDWFPSDELFSKRSQGGKYSGYLRMISKRLHAISELSYNAEEFVQACDYDLEGETIGANVIDYSCKRLSRTTWRAKFSTLTEEELRASFSNLTEVDKSMVSAGRARHVVDFLWGINLSRALSETYRAQGHGFRNLTIGRVQGPTLHFIGQRELEAFTHVPLPFWSLHARLSKNGFEFVAHYETERIEEKQLAEAFAQELSREHEATVQGIHEALANEHPPYPFNLGELQKEAYRLYRFSPSLTLSVAEKLYLEALISYPRTSSQKLPPSIGYTKILNSLLNSRDYSNHSEELREGKRRSFPIQGFKDDPAHPAIYPTGTLPKRKLEAKEIKIYNLIVLRFLADFAEDAKFKEVKVELLIGSRNFAARGSALLKSGWRKIYSFWDSKQASLPELMKGEQVPVLGIEVESHCTRGPPLYSESSLLQKMDSENIGTKATRARVISTLLDREFISKEKSGGLVSTDTGQLILEVAKQNCPEILSVDLTRRTEQELDDIMEKGKPPERLISDTIRQVLKVAEELRHSKDHFGARLESTSSRRTRESQRAREKGGGQSLLLSNCPVCLQGTLRVIRSRATGKRFIGCSNYASGCRASSPLPRKGSISWRSGEICKDCKWPVLSLLYFRGGKKGPPWKFCANIRCPTKERNKVNLAAS